MKLPPPDSQSASINDDPLARRLRAEALAGTPAFSPELHETVMRALGEKGIKLLSTEEVHKSSQRRTIMRIAAPLAAAAAIAIFAWMGLHEPSKTQNTSQSNDSEITGLLPPALVHDVENAVALPTGNWEDAKYCYVDQDARRLAIFVADQIPSLNIPEDNSPK